MNRRQFLLAGSAGMAGAGCRVQRSTIQSTAPPGLTAIQERKPMTAFSLPDLDGKIVHSSDLRGNVVILRFWATW